MNRTAVILLLGAILLGGFAIRCVHLYDVARSPHLAHPISDAAYNDYWARGRITGIWPPNPHPDGPLLPQIPYIKAPGYPYILSLFYRVTGGSYLGAHVLQMLIGLMSCGLLFLLTRRLFGNITGLLATALMASYWVFIYFENMLHAPVLVVFFSLLLLYLVIHFYGAGSETRPTNNTLSTRAVGRLSESASRISWLCKALIIGLVIGLFGVVRKNVFVFLPPLILWLWWVKRRNDAAFNLRRTVLLIVVGALLPIAPSLIRNALVADSFVPISCDAGRNLYIGNNAWANGVHPILPEQLSLGLSQGLNLFSYPSIVFALQNANVDTASFPKAEKYFAGKAVRYMIANPLRTVRLTIKKAFLFWGPDEVSSDQVAHYDRLASRVLKRLPFGFAHVFALGLTGIIMLLAQWRYQGNVPARVHEPAILILLFMLTMFLSFLPGLPESRYRVGLIPFLMLFGAHGITMIGSSFARKAWTTSILWITLATVTYAMVGARYTQYRPDRAKWHYEQGVIYADAGIPDIAALHYTSAIKVRSNFVEAHNNLGIALAQLERFADAERHFMQAIELNPRYMQPYNSLVALKLKQNEPDEALALSHRLLAIQPGTAKTYYNMAFAHAQKNDLERAIELYQKALTLHPSYAQAHNNLGALYIRTGEPDKAMQHFEEALRLDPTFQQARNNRDRLQAMRTQTLIEDEPPRP